jgi:hypothetical protein
VRLRRMTIPTLAMAAALTAVGCGSASNTLTRSQLIAKADPICKQANSRLDAALAIKNKQAIPAAAASAAAYELQASIQLAKLNPPSTMAADWKAIVAEFRTVAKSINQLGEQYKNGRKLDVNIANEFTGAQHRRAVIAAQNGFKNCSKY